jgi:outer membrane lipoprotein LolB
MLPRWSAIALTLVWIGGSGLLTACASLSEDAATPVIDRPARTLITHFNIEGRLSVQHEARRHAVNLYWQHTPATDELLLSTPLGQGLARLQRDAASARLRLADQRELMADNWEALAQQLIGVDLPLANLPYWVLGLANQTPPQQSSLDAMGRLQWQQADGWRVNYLAYESPHAQALPTLLELRHGDTEVRLKIDHWQLGDPPP